jgi:twitching motility protein PilI
MSKRVSLKQFQQDLSTRLQNAGTRTTLATSLGVRVGEENWLIELGNISEVIAPGPWIRVPLAKPWLLGVANIRGKLYSVVDLPAFSGHASVIPGPDTRLLLVHSRFAVNAALLVDQTLGLRSLEPANEQETGTSDTEWVSRHYRDGQNVSWKVLDMGALVSHPTFLQAGI